MGPRGTTSAEQQKPFTASFRGTWAARQQRSRQEGGPRVGGNHGGEQEQPPTTTKAQGGEVERTSSASFFKNLNHPQEEVEPLISIAGNKTATLLDYFRTVLASSRTGGAQHLLYFVVVAMILLLILFLLLLGGVAIRNFISWRNNARKINFYRQEQEEDEEKLKHQHAGHTGTTTKRSVLDADGKSTRPAERTLASMGATKITGNEPLFAAAFVGNDGDDREDGDETGGDLHYEATKGAGSLVF
ncbi:unnamed protein product [Amoebophrya sp. A120]|nr:unnamed protein product [Amoebophrya sp. A120]|eukprot:GSA120T00007303001.1